MNPAARLAGYGVGLVALFAAGVGAGAAVGPWDDAGHPSGTSEGEEQDVSGLHATEEGYTFVPAASVLSPGQRDPFRFRIVGPDGQAVRAFRPQHERDLHLIVASVDLGTFAHVHPVRAADGEWSVPVPVSAPGRYRAFADFAAADGPALVLGVDLTVEGPPGARPLPPPAATTSVDGYEVTLSGAPTAAGEADVTLRVERDGRLVDDLEPYLGAYGHLVALRAGDLAYLHVHPEGHPGDGVTRPGPEVTFGTDLPTAGDYRLFFDFQHQGVVRTAAFTVPVAGEAGARPSGGHGGHRN